MQYNDELQFWSDLYRPQTLAECKVHARTAEVMQRLAGSSNMPNLMIYGPDGAGKRTLAWALLNQLYGRLGGKVETVSIKTATTGESKTIDVSIVQSPHHMELYVSQLRPNQDRHVIFSLIKSFASQQTLLFDEAGAGDDQEPPPKPKPGFMRLAVIGADDTLAHPLAPSTSHQQYESKPNTSRAPSRTKFKTLVIHDADSLSRAAQQALRRTMEVNSRICCMVFLCRSASRIIAPLRSRCMMLRVPLPTVDMGISTLVDIGRRHAVSDKFGKPLPRSLLTRAARLCMGASERNLCRALLAFQAMCVEQLVQADCWSSSRARAGASDDDDLEQDDRGDAGNELQLQVARPDWHVTVENIGKALSVPPHNATAVLHQRDSILMLLQNHIEPTEILKRLCDLLTGKTLTTSRWLTDSHRHGLVQAAAVYQYRLLTARTHFIHIEAFMIEFLNTLASSKPPVPAVSSKPPVPAVSSKPTSAITPTRRT